MPIVLFYGGNLKIILIVVSSNTNGTTIPNMNCESLDCISRDLLNPLQISSSITLSMYSSYKYFTWVKSLEYSDLTYSL